MPLITEDRYLSSEICVHHMSTEAMGNDHLFFKPVTTAFIWMFFWPACWIYCCPVHFLLYDHSTWNVFALRNWSHISHTPSAGLLPPSSLNALACLWTIHISIILLKSLFFVILNKNNWNWEVKNIHKVTCFTVYLQLTLWLFLKKQYKPPFYDGSHSGRNLDSKAWQKPLALFPGIQKEEPEYMNAASK